MVLIGFEFLDVGNRPLDVILQFFRAHFRWLTSIIILISVKPPCNALTLRYAQLGLIALQLSFELFPFGAPWRSHSSVGWLGFVGTCYLIHFVIVNRHAGF